MAGSTFPAYIRAEYKNDQTAFAKFESDFANSGKRAKTAIDQALSGVRDTVAQALTVPRNAFGSLDVGVDQLRKMETQLEATATASREVQRALVTEARATEGLTQSKASAIRAAGQFARATEAELSALRQNIAFNERLQAELNKTASATNAVVNAANRGTTAFGQQGESLRGQRQAFVQTGQQLQDLGISLYSGQRASTVFAQQLPQLAFALTSLEGSTNKTQNAIGKFAAMLSGPLGSVALVAASIGLGVLVEKLFSAEDAAKKAGHAFETTAEKLDLKKNSVEEVTKALKEYNAEQEKSRVITLESAKATAFKIAEDLRETIAIRTKLKALFEENATRAAIAFAQSGGNLGSALGAYLTGESQITAKVAEQDKIIAELTKGAKNAVIEVADEIAKINSDPSYKLDVGFDALRNDARKTITDFTALQKKLTEINNQEKAAQKALAEANKKTRKKSERPSTAPDLVNFAGLSDIVQGYSNVSSGLGRRTAPTKGATTVHGGLDIPAPLGTSVRAPYLGTVELVGQDKGSGKYIVIDHGAGTKTRFKHLSDNSFVKPGDAVAKGDLIGKVGSTGVSTGNHLHYEAILGGKFNNAGKLIAGKYTDPRGKLPVGDADVSADTERRLEDKRKEVEKFKEELQIIDQITQRITGEFDDQPKLIDRISSAGLKLRQTTEDINRKLTNANLTAEQRLELETRLLNVKKSQEAADGALEKRANDIMVAQEGQLKVQRLAASGRGFESELLQEILQETKEIGKLDTVGAERVQDRVTQRILETQQIERQNAALQNQIGLVDNIASASKNAIYDLLNGKGLKAGKNLIGSIFDSYLQAKSEEIYDALLGDVFKKQKLKILGLDKVDEAGREMAVKMNRAAIGLERLENAAIGAANALAPANDNFSGRAKTAAERAFERANGGGIVVNGKRKSADDTLRSTISGLAEKAFGKELSDKIAGTIGKAFKGAAIGQAVNGFLKPVGKLLGFKTSNIGAQLGGAAGQLIGGPIGSIVGSTIGSIVGGLFKKTKKADLTITNSSVSSRGTKSLLGDLTEGGNGIQDRIKAIAEQLNGSVGAFSLAIKQKGKKFTFGGKKYDDFESAAEAALLSAIQNGAVQGISAGAQRLLKAGTDLDRQLQKALSFQGVFDRLKEIDDPVGAALDKLDREFTNLKSIFAEAGASAAEYADLQRLYDMDRAKAIEEANSRITASLKSLYADLTINNDALSLRDRQSAAKAAYDPLAARVAAGDKTAYDAYADAAKSLLDIERSLYGSQSGYFDRLSEVTNLTKARIDEESNVTSIDRLGLTFTDAITTQTNALLAGLQPALLALNTNIGTLIAQNQNFGGGGGDFNYQTQQSF